MYTTSSLSISYDLRRPPEGEGGAAVTPLVVAGLPDWLAFGLGLGLGPLPGGGAAIRKRCKLSSKHIRPYL
jgi:hypothetical protein